MEDNYFVGSLDIYDSEEKRTSQDWYNKLYPQRNLIILDPDGWDRRNYQFSWYEEFITEEQFNNRVFGSTVVFGPGVIAKKDLTDGDYYYNRHRARGMRVGLWNAKLQKFICMQQNQPDQYIVYHLNHVEDDEGGAIFEPIVNMSAKIKNVDLPFNKKSI